MKASMTETFECACDSLMSCPLSTDVTEPLAYIPQRLIAKWLTLCLTDPHKRKHSPLVKQKRGKAPEKLDETILGRRRFLNHEDVLWPTRMRFVIKLGRKFWGYFILISRWPDPVCGLLEIEIKLVTHNNSLFTDVWGNVLSQEILHNTENWTQICLVQCLLRNRMKII